jgi:hypothetical protein
MSRSLSRRFPLLLVAAVSLPTLASAQSIYQVINGTVLEYGVTGFQLFSTSSGCGPATPMSSIPFGNTFPCVPFPFVVPPQVPPAPSEIGMGDVAVDRGADIVWITDGKSFVGFTPQGAQLGAFTKPAGLWDDPSLPNLLTYVRGMGCQALPPAGPGIHAPLGLLWVTNGTEIAAIQPPPLPNPPCLPATIAVAPFTPTPALAGPANDIDFDSATGTLWVGDEAGFVTNVAAGGGPGPFGSFNASAPNACGSATPPLPVRGLAVDAASPTPPTLILKLGSLATGRRLMPPGIAAPPTTYCPDSCFVGGAAGNTGGANASRLGFSARPTEWSGSTNETDVIGQLVTGPLVPANSVTFTVTGVGPNSVAVLFMDFFALCPAVTIPGTFISLSAAPTFILPPVPATLFPNTAAMTIPYSGTMVPPGPLLAAQWAVIDLFTSNITTSKGLMLTFAAL